ncbi:uncharacterized protein A1O9_10464 [Exophiala aquamarina CBS 119918]|uniref:Uncharacterized protein n=1 Tax=Exophiala aquamarina CBS 119918 TaxID=1182545 RepID=A0A072P043_9EURO|nr:uncharacterized protein A1O9_10464 [Exophiala aquamarina CBS 119918]KEF53489.1 hypothetical protein A1O9_10464 [Exophiala aquamarina CBS 119918]
MVTNIVDSGPARPERNSLGREVNEPPSPQQTIQNLRASSTEKARARLLPASTVEKSAKESSNISKPSRAQWLPIALRWPYLCTILGVTLIVLAVVIALHVRSKLHSGLADDDGSNGTYFLSRFLPTVVAVSYVFATSIILEDVKRSEPYARMSSPAGAPATNTLFWVARAWWTTLYDSLPSKKRGQRFSCSMFCASLVLILGFLILSPFSSTFLVTNDVVFSKDRTFGQLPLSSRLPIQPTASSTTYFRTIGNVLQNVTTSSWITEKYAVLPLWPADQIVESMSAFVGQGSEIWHAETLVVSTELECEPLDLTDVSWVQGVLQPEYTDPSITFATESGCTLSMIVSNSSGLSAFASWTVPTDFASDDAHAFNSTGCIGDEVMMFATPPLAGNLSVSSPDPNIQAKGLLCTAQYFYANATVAVTVGSGESVVTVDEQEYMANRRPVPESFFDVIGAQNVFLTKTSWPQRLFAGNDYIEIRGPGALLAASYEFSVERLVQDQLLLSKAQTLKQRFLGEMLRDTFDSALLSDEPRVQVDGKVSSNRRRVLVVPAVAITLEVALGINFILLLLTLMNSRLSKRPLELNADPATSIAVATFASQEPHTLRQLNDASIANPLELLTHLKDLWCRNMDNGLYIFDPGHRSDGQQTAKLMKKLKTSSSLPTVLHLVPVLCLFVSMLAVAVTISVLLGFSETDDLYQTAFVYQIDFAVAGMQLDAINPAAVLTTFLAACITLWWGAVESSIRKLQPFLALAKGPVRTEDGTGLSYETSYLLWAAVKAIKRSHWLLALVSCGAFYAEIFTISMSALWSRTHSEKNFVSQIPVSLEIRQIPLVLVGHLNNNDFYSSAYRGEALRESFTNQTTSWMYGANIQLALNGSQPPWSSDGWSFAPVDLSVLPKKTLQNIGDDSATSDESGVPLPSSTLATLDTAAMHARIECIPYDPFEDTSIWTTEQDLTNSTYWNTSSNPSSLETAYELGTIACSTDNPNIGLGYLCGTAGGINVTTTFYVQPPQLSCCENRTEDEYGLASVGYWSANRSPGVLFPSVTADYPFNFTVKWIHGTPQEGFVMANASSESRRLLWHEPPEMTALNCRPIIETANARVTVDITSLKVQHYSLTSDPVPDTKAWNDLFTYHVAEEDLPSDINGYPVNVTVSHGAYFLAALIGASDISALSATPRSGYQDTETLDDQTFNIRKQGLNLDYMSYSMLSLVGFDPTALLNPTTMERTAQQVFSTFFQHFASSSVTTAQGGWAFQKLDERLPADLTDVEDQSTVDPPANPRAGELVSVEVVQPVEVLKMSRVAATIALAVLLWLLVSTLALAWRSRTYKARLRWRVETIADVLLMVAGSERLLGMLKAKDMVKTKVDPHATAMLADFTTKDRNLRWGIELATADVTKDTRRESAPAVTTAMVPLSPSHTVSPTPVQERAPLIPTKITSPPL